MKEHINKLPQEFLHRIKQIYPKDYSGICETFLIKKRTTFRINHLKTSLKELKKHLAQEKIKYRQLNWPEGSFILDSPLRRLQQSFIYKEGLVYVQNISSMVPPIVLEPKEKEKILDLCAAPGAKTTQLASLTEDSAEIIAIEKIRIRYYKLLANLRIQGVSSVKALLFDGIRIRKKYYEYFDKILLDAPCSAEGRFYVYNPRSYKYWKPKKVKEMVHKQKRLFAAAFYALRQEGIIVYSTCTFSPEENEEIVDWALAKFSPKLKLLPLNLPLSNLRRGLIKWRNKKLAPSLSLCCRIIPQEYMEGFFIAKLQKV